MNIFLYFRKNSFLFFLVILSFFFCFQVGLTYANSYTVQPNGNGFVVTYQYQTGFKNCYKDQGVAARVALSQPQIGDYIHNGQRYHRSRDLNLGNYYFFRLIDRTQTTVYADLYYLSYKLGEIVFKDYNTMNMGCAGNDIVFLNQTHGRSRDFFVLNIDKLRLLNIRVEINTASTPAQLKIQEQEEAKEREREKQREKERQRREKQRREEEKRRKEEERRRIQAQREQARIQRQYRRKELQKQRTQLRKTTLQSRSTASTPTTLRGSNVEIKKWQKRLQKAKRRGGWKEANRELLKIKAEQAQKKRFKKDNEERQKKINARNQAYARKTQRKWDLRRRNEQRNRQMATQIANDLYRACSRTNSCDQVETIMLLPVGLLAIAAGMYYTYTAHRGALRGINHGQYDPISKSIWGVILWGTSAGLISSKGKYKSIERSNWSDYLWGYYGSQGISKVMLQSLKRFNFTYSIGLGLDDYQGLMGEPTFFRKYSENLPIKNGYKNAFEVSQSTQFFITQFLINLSVLRLGWYVGVGPFTTSTKYEIGVQPFGEGLLSPFISLLGNFEYNHINDSSADWGETTTHKPYFVDRDRMHLFVGNTFHLLNLDVDEVRSRSIMGMSLQVGYAYYPGDFDKHVDQFRRDRSFFMLNLGMYYGAQVR